MQRVERRVQESLTDGLVQYYVDERDRQVGECEGTLEHVQVEELTAAEFVVFVFGMSLRENL